MGLIFNASCDKTLKTTNFDENCKKCTNVWNRFGKDVEKNGQFHEKQLIFIASKRRTIEKCENLSESHKEMP